VHGGGALPDGGAPARARRDARQLPGETRQGKGGEVFATRTTLGGWWLETPGERRGGGPSNRHALRALGTTDEIRKDPVHETRSHGGGDDDPADARGRRGRPAKRGAREVHAGRGGVGGGVHGQVRGERVAGGRPARDEQGPGEEDPAGQGDRRRPGGGRG